MDTRYYLHYHYSDQVMPLSCFRFVYAFILHCVCAFLLMYVFCSAVMIDLCRCIYWHTYGHAVALVVLDSVHKKGWCDKQQKQKYKQLFAARVRPSTDGVGGAEGLFG